MRKQITRILIASSPELQNGTLGINSFWAYAISYASLQVMRKVIPLKEGK
jgi:hypothetical protein